MSEIGGPIDDGGIAAKDDPFALFDAWMEEAKKAEPAEPNAKTDMALVRIRPRMTAKCEKLTPVADAPGSPGTWRLRSQSSRPDHTPPATAKHRTLT